ncbi:DUF2507 domain-containing protein [Methanocaldococcus indicus]|uniref:DUF2507 domain-containing protein n=1 Tax=Methanocaldococcus indicus TaxID=213231 RepID=UPI003C6D246B
MKFNVHELSKNNRKSFGNNIDIAIFRIIRYMDLDRYLGKSANMIIYQCGKSFGKSLELSSIEDIIKFCEKFKIGKVEIVNKEPLKIRVYECISCSGLPDVGETLCYFEGGFIAGCLENLLNKKVIAKETHCAGLGHDFCQFDIRLL